MASPCSVTEKHNRLTFVCSVEQRVHRRKAAVWRCDCGTKKVLPIDRVRHGIIRSCGCLMIEMRGSGPRTHGMRNSSEYRVWGAVKGRCLNRKHKDYPRYGARGITLFPEWAVSFEAFYNELGPRPPGTSIDRIDNTKGYVPGNVRWATPSEQQRNRASAFVWFIKGKVFQTCEDAAQYFHVSKQCVWRWVNGAFDKRRNTQTYPREDCYVVSRY